MAYETAVEPVAPPMTMIESSQDLSQKTDTLLGQISILESALGLSLNEAKCGTEAPRTLGECIGQSRSNVCEAQERLARMIDALGRVDVPMPAAPRF